MKKAIAWIKANKLEFLLLFLLIVVSAFIRFYQINRLDFFTYDQARDALYIKRILVDHKFRLIGTQSSIPGLYTGPAYYYLMAPFLFLFNLSPIGIDFATAIFGVLTVFLIYYLVGLITGSFLTGIMVSFLYSTQAQILEQSRFSWNPNPGPLFFVLFLLGLYKILKGGKRWWMAVFPSLAILLQLHYSGVCLIPVLILFIFVHRKKISLDKWFYFSVIFFILLMSPLGFFDLRHNFTGTKAIINYLKQGTGGKIPPPPFAVGFIEKMKYLLVELPFGIKNSLFSSFLLIGMVLGFIIDWVKNKDNRGILLVLLLTLLLGIVVASGYKGSFFNFYLTLMYPLGFLLMGYLLKGKNLKKSFNLLIIAVFILIFSRNLVKIIPRLPRKDAIPGLKSVASVIAADVDEKTKFNLIGILGEGRFDYNAVDYRYFLETFFRKKALDWDVLDYREAKVVYLISSVGPIEPLKLNVWELQQFSPKEVVASWKINQGETIVYKLIK